MLSYWGLGVQGLGVQEYICWGPDGVCRGWGLRGSRRGTLQYPEMPLTCSVGYSHIALCFGTIVS